MWYLRGWYDEFVELDDDYLLGWYMWPALRPGTVSNTANPALLFSAQKRFCECSKVVDCSPILQRIILSCGRQLVALWG